MRYLLQWVSVGSLANTQQLTQRPALRPSLLTIKVWMQGTVGFFPICGVLLEHAQMKSDARRLKSADHTDLIHQGGEGYREPWKPPVILFFWPPHSDARRPSIFVQQSSKIWMIWRKKTAFSFSSLSEWWAKERKCCKTLKRKSIFSLFFFWSSNTKFTVILVKMYLDFCSVWRNQKYFITMRCYSNS